MPRYLPVDVVRVKVSDLDQMYRGRPPHPLSESKTLNLIYKLRIYTSKTKPISITTLYSIIDIIPSPQQPM
jgi:hypothetical protein